VADIDWFPLLLSLRVAAIATLLTTVVGVTGAYVLARHRFPGSGLLEAVASLPIVLPPTVLGYYLLV
jgi:molybdate transport system permease protein